MLDGDVRRVVERILGEGWGGSVTIRAAAAVAGRSHVIRLTADDGRTAILKRPRPADDGGWWSDASEGFATEWAALDLLGAMPEPVAPRLLGGDPERRLLVVEDLASGRLLAHSLLGDDPAAAGDDLVAYATALAAVGAWSRERAAEHADARRRQGLDPAGRSWWIRAIGRGRQAFFAAAAQRGIPTAPAEDEMTEVERMLDGGVAAGFVHGDPCPDNVVLVDGRCRLVDFERSSWGSLVLDAGYLVAPFPSCWCFAELPVEVTGPALAAYHARLVAGGPEPEFGADGSWDQAMAAALVGWLAVRGDAIARAWDRDGDATWGTTTMWPRLRRWLDAFLAAPGAAAFPALTQLAATLAEQAHEVSPAPPAPVYPAFAGSDLPGAVEAPADWVT